MNVKNLVIVGLIVVLTVVSVSLSMQIGSLTEQNEILETHYQWAMEISKLTPQDRQEIIEKIQLQTDF